MVLAGCGEWLYRRLFMSFRLAIVVACVRSTLECGGSTPPWHNAAEEDEGGVEPPHSKVLRTAIFVRAAVSDTAAKDLGKSTGHVTKNVETSGARACSREFRGEHCSPRACSGNFAAEHFSQPASWLKPKRQQAAALQSFARAHPIAMQEAGLCSFIE